MPARSQPQPQTTNTASNPASAGLIGCLILVVMVIGGVLITVVAGVRGQQNAPIGDLAASPTISTAVVFVDAPTVITALATNTVPPTIAPGPTPALEATETLRPVFITPTPVPPTLTATPLPRPTITPTFSGPTNGNTPLFNVIPDSELVNSPSAVGFDVAAFIARQPGLIASYQETVFGRVMTAADMVSFVATSTSVHPRLLLAMLEYRGGWLSQREIDQATRDYTFSAAEPTRKGLISQLFIAANGLNTGYYGYKTRGVTRVTLADGQRLRYPDGLTAGTVALQYFFAQIAPTADQWVTDISPAGLYRIYVTLFGDPFRFAVTPLVPPDLAQPPLILPFARGEAWIFGAGPHGGWDRLGSAWGAVDFTPPRPPDSVLNEQGRCYVADLRARAMARGLVVRARDGAVVLDLDMDGDERTGWTLLYLHIAIKDRVTVGTVVEAGESLGRPSCEGFFLNSVNTHLHIARRYNGEWIATDCTRCRAESRAPDFVMSGWRPRSSGEASFGWLEAAPGIFLADGPKPGARVEMRNPITW